MDIFSSDSWENLKKSNRLVSVKLQHFWKSATFCSFSPSWGKWLICTKAVGWGSDLCASEPILEPAVSDISQVNVSHPYVLYTRARVYFSARITLGPDMVRNNNITLPRWPWTARRCDLLILVAKHFPTWNGYLIPSLEYCTNSDWEKCFWMMLISINGWHNIA